MTDPPTPLPPPPDITAGGEVPPPRRHLSSGPAQTFDSSGAWAAIGALAYGLFALIYGGFAAAAISASRPMMKEVGSLAGQADASVPAEMQGAMDAIVALLDQTIPWSVASAVVAAVLTAGAIGAIRGSDAARKLCVWATVGSAVVAVAYTVWGLVVLGPAMESAMESMMKGAARGSRPIPTLFGTGQNNASTVCWSVFQVGSLAVLFWALRTSACRRWCGAPTARRDGSPSAL